MKYISFVLFVSAIVVSSNSMARNLMHESFEYKKLNPKYWNEQGSGGELTDEIRAREGKYSYKMQTLVSEDAKKGSSPELYPSGKMKGVGYGVPSSKGQWYGFSVFVPKESTKDLNDGKVDVLTEFYDSSDKFQRAKLFDVRMDNGVLKGEMLINKPFIGSYHDRKMYPSVKRFDVGEVKVGQWNDIAIYTKFSNGSDGQAKVYLNGKKMFEHEGSIGLLGGKSNYIKLGLKRKGAWGKEKSNSIAPPEMRTYYLDAVKFGDQSLRDVTPRRKLKKTRGFTRDPAKDRFSPFSSQ